MLRFHTMFRRGTRLTAAAILVVTAACAKKDDAASDSAASDTSAMAGMAHDSAGMAGMANSTATGDQGFLQQMSNHHEGLIAMATAAMSKAAAAATQGDAHKLHTAQTAERDSMVAMVHTQYGAAGFTPTAMPEHKAMNDSLQSLSGPAYDRTFYRMVVQHHREGLAMIDSVMPTLTAEKVKQMATRMKEMQQREITEFERKAGGS